MDSSTVLAVAFWGLWRGRRRDRAWKVGLEAQIERLVASDPDSVELTVEGLRSEIGDRLDHSVSVMRDRGYRLISVIPEHSELAWTARFERRSRP